MREIKLNESTVDEQRFRAVLDEDQIEALIVAAVAAAAGVDPKAKNVVKTVRISNSNAGGINPSHYQAVCDLVVDRSPAPPENGAS
ncbi:hypothetical protein [Cupriavidus pampae]|uniref:Uncharacterized protein n=1 Tax=Cupriavidus pampae TaxID=659251 RepID=A0ABM8XCA4_9BURK|nr:hypothetical protein [Cupriavidus pampae]CAG9177696.1 hypothetical protein LMG32289_03877 [Cupriavidus pampae]